MTITYDFSGKTVLIIGGTTGIGRAAALAFAAAGAGLSVAGLGAADGESLRHEALAQGAASFHFTEVDVRDEAQVARLTAETIERSSRIDIAFNNAGIPGKAAPVHELSEAEFDLIMDVNLKGIFFGLKYQIPHMLAMGGGVIVNTASLFGVMGYATTATYCASKWGVIGLTKSAALEVARHNIRINAIAPGSTMTPLLVGMFGGEQKAIDTVKPLTPLGRVADPKEIAQVVLFLASDAASFVTGEAVVADGGGFVANA